MILQSTHARFDLARIVEGFRRAAGDDVAAVAERAYGGLGAPVTDEEWAPCWAAFGLRVPDDAEEARMIVNSELNAPGLELMRGFDVVEQLAGIKCPAFICVGELDPVTPVGAAEEIFGALPEELARLEVIEGAGHFTWEDAPDRYWPVLLDFVKSTTGPERIEAAT